MKDKFGSLAMRGEQMAEQVFLVDVNRLQTGSAGLSMPPWTGAKLPRRRIHERVED